MAHERVRTSWVRWRKLGPTVKMDILVPDRADFCAIHVVIVDGQEICREDITGIELGLLIGNFTQINVPVAKSVCAQIAEYHHV